MSCWYVDSSHRALYTIIRNYNEEPLPRQTFGRFRWLIFIFYLFIFFRPDVKWSVHKEGKKKKRKNRPPTSVSLALSCQIFIFFSSLPCTSKRITQTRDPESSIQLAWVFHAMSRQGWRASLIYIEKPVKDQSHHVCLPYGAVRPTVYSSPVAQCLEGLPQTPPKATPTAMQR